LAPGARKSLLPRSTKSKRRDWPKKRSRKRLNNKLHLHRKKYSILKNKKKKIKKINRVRSNSI
jgi:hypothetical protein